MANIYVGQTNLTITIDTGISLVGASSPVILYQKPNDVKGQWVATISGTTLIYTVGPTDLDTPGPWYLQAQVNFGGTPTFGQVVEMDVSIPLK